MEDLNNQKVEWTDIMVDVETTGTSIATAGVIQLSAVMFNLEKGIIGPEFDSCLLLPEGYFWEAKTLNWWVSNPKRKIILDEITKKSLNPKEVINSFIRWNRVEGPAKHFWSKPSHFDFTLLDKYFRMYGFQNPFKYWKARDMRSYLLGIMFPEPLPELRLESDDAHNALADVKFQVMELIKYTQKYTRDYKGEK